MQGVYSTAPRILYHPCCWHTSTKSECSCHPRFTQHVGLAFQTATVVLPSQRRTERADGFAFYHKSWSTHLACENSQYLKRNDAFSPATGLTAQLWECFLSPQGREQQRKWRPKGWTVAWWNQIPCQKAMPLFLFQHGSLAAPSLLGTCSTPCYQASGNKRVAREQRVLFPTVFEITAHHSPLEICGLSSQGRLQGPRECGCNHTLLPKSLACSENKAVHSQVTSPGTGGRVIRSTHL